MPQLEVVQDEVVAAGGDAAAGAGADTAGDIDDIDDPPPQALRAAISTAHAAPGNHRRVVDSLAGRFERCIEVLPVMPFVWVSAHLRHHSYTPARRRTPKNRAPSRVWLSQFSVAAAT
jgi:hypothetical protein